MLLCSFVWHITFSLPYILNTAFWFCSCFKISKAFGFSSNAKWKGERNNDDRIVLSDDNHQQVGHFLAFHRSECLLISTSVFVENLTAEQLNPLSHLWYVLNFILWSSLSKPLDVLSEVMRFLFKRFLNPVILFKGYT